MGTALFYLGFASIVGTLAGGWLGDRYGARDARWYMWIPGMATIAALPFSLFAYLWDEPTFALWGLVLPYLFGAYWLAPTFSMTQGLVGLRMRALASGILLFVINIFGMGIGPQFTGILSDVFQATTESRRGFVALGVGGQPRIQLVCGNSVLVCDARISRRRRSWVAAYFSLPPGQFVTDRFTVPGVF